MAEKPAGSKVIDLHAHVVLEAGLGKAGSYGPELGQDADGVPFFRFGGYAMKPMSYAGTVFMDTSMRLDALEKHGIDMQLLSPNPLTMFHHIAPADAINFCKAQNDAMAELVQAHPDKLLGSISLPIQDVDASIQELERGTKELGLHAAHLGTNFPFDIHDPCLDPFYAALVELDMPLFMHPASSGGETGPDDARLSAFDMTILLGYAYEETIAVAQLILGGVTDRHPDLDVCVSHGGGAMAFLLPRFRDMSSFRAWTPDSVKEVGFVKALERLWYDAHVHGETQHQMLIDGMGTEKLVYGTNFGGWDTPHAADAFAASLTPNAERLLRLNK